MSKVYVRDNSNVWVPISHEAGAVPNKVYGLTSGLVFKSICGVAAPASPTRYIRNAANTDWIPLDEVVVVDPPTLIGTRSNTRTSNQGRCYPHGNAQIGDLIVSSFSQRVGSFVTFSSGTMQLLWQFQNTNLLAQPCIGAVVHTGATYYTLNSSEFGATTTWAATIRGAGDVNSLRVGNSTYSPSSQTKNILSHPAAANDLVLAWIIDEYISGVPYSYSSGVFNFHSELNAGSSYNDVMLAEYISLAGGNTGAGVFFGNASSNSGYTSQTIGVPPA